ncbi:hypothetical protein RQP46_001813 [Phenoliferia psychrophenolica]
MSAPQPPIQSQPAQRPPMTPLFDFTPQPSKGPQSESGKWSTGLCACSPGGFCMSFCCPCIVNGQIRQRYDALAGNYMLQPGELETCGNMSVTYCAVNCIAGVGFLLDFFQRATIRNRYGIEGSAGSDILYSCCCNPCAQQQHSRELALEEKARENQVTIQPSPPGPADISPSSPAPVYTQEKSS